MRIAFYAPLKPPDHPMPSGDRRIAQLFDTRQAHLQTIILLANVIEAPTIELALGYHKENKSSLLELFLSKVDDLIARVAKRSGGS